MAKDAKRYKYRRMLIWAESGFVRMEDQDTGEFITITRREALERARAINKEICHMAGGDRDEAHQLVQNLLEVVRDARNQGDPTDPDVMTGLVREMKRSSGSKVLLPSKTVPGHETVPPLGRFLNNGRVRKKAAKNTDV